jgi:hypothetical protein
MNYQNGWTHLEEATEKQLSASNDARRDELAATAASLFRQIPEVDESHYAQNEHRRLFAIAKVLWRKIEVIEELMHDSGARFVRNNEGYSEDEGRRDLLD